MKKDMEAHLHCPLCSFVGDVAAQGNHASQCPQRQIQCKCGTTYAAIDEQRHKCVCCGRVNSVCAAH